MPKENIIYVFGLLKKGKEEKALHLKYKDFKEDKNFEPLVSKPSMHLRKHYLILQIESEQGRLSLFASKAKAMVYPKVWTILV